MNRRDTTPGEPAVVERTDVHVAVQGLLDLLDLQGETVLSIHVGASSITARVAVRARGRVVPGLVLSRRYRVVTG